MIYFVYFGNFTLLSSFITLSSPQNPFFTLDPPCPRIYYLVFVCVCVTCSVKFRATCVSMATYY